MMGEDGYSNKTPSLVQSDADVINEMLDGGYGGHGLSIAHATDASERAHRPRVRSRHPDRLRDDPVIKARLYGVRQKKSVKRDGARWT